MTTDIDELQQLVKGYRAIAKGFEEELDRANWRVKTLDDLTVKQDRKIQFLRHLLGREMKHEAPPGA